MKQLKFILMLALLPKIAEAQEYIPWETYYLQDSVLAKQEFDFNEHTSIYPRINKRRTDFGENRDKSYLPKRWSFMPVSDFVFCVNENFNTRMGAGFAADYIPLRGMHLRFAYVGGYSTRHADAYNGDVGAYSFLRWNIPNELGVHFHDIRTRLSYSANKYFNFQVGLDQNRFGEGNRSLLLDDYGSPYPFAAFRMKLWRAEYVLLHTYLHTPNANQNNFRPKHSTMHYLSLNLFKGFNLSLFEAVVYDGIIQGQRRGFEFEYLNPMVIYRPVEYGLGSTDKIQVGANLSYRFSPKLMLYGQFMFDEFLLAELRARSRWWANKYGFQVGLKGQSAIKDGLFHYLSEVNMVRPFTFAHNNAGQAFTNMHLPLAHPYGANFMESSSRFLYQKNAWDFGLDVVYLMRGTVGSDINNSNMDRPLDENGNRINFGYFLGAGQKYNLFKLQATAGYNVLPKYRMRAFITLDSSWLSQAGKTNNYFTVFFGFRSELWNDRRDY
jgi:hypothetical protein